MLKTVFDTETIAGSTHARILRPSHVQIASSTSKKVLK